jgi:hypothetical protein
MAAPVAVVSTLVGTRTGRPVTSALICRHSAPLYGTLIYFLLGVVYFAVAGRHRLVLSPEEEFALTRGEHGHPETEGYGTTHVADIGAGGAVVEEATTREAPTS